MSHSGFQRRLCRESESFSLSMPIPVVCKCSLVLSHVRITLSSSYTNVKRKRCNEWKIQLLLRKTSQCTSLYLILSFGEKQWVKSAFHVAAILMFDPSLSLSLSAWNLHLHVIFPHRGRQPLSLASKVILNTMKEVNLCLRRASLKSLVCVGSIQHLSYSYYRQVCRTANECRDTNLGGEGRKGSISMPSCYD